MNAWRTLTLMAVCIVALGAFTPSGFALKFESGDMFVLSEDDVVSDDLVVAGSDVRIAGTVDGDLVVFGANVIISGDVTGDIVVFCGDVVARGDAGDDGVFMCGNVDLSGDVSDNLIAFGGSVRISEDSSLGRDAFVGGSAAQVYGDVSRNLDVRGSNVVVGANVGGNLSIESDDAPRLASGASVAGDVNYVSSDDIVIDEGASVSGSVNKEVPTEPAKSDTARFFDSLSGFLSIFLVGFILVKMFPVYTRNVCNALRKSYMASALWGIAGLILVPFAALFLAISVIGLPVALIVVAAYLVLIYVSKVYVSVFVGKYVLGVAGSKSDSLVLMLAVGLLVFEVIGLVPVLGGFAALFVLVFGFGAILLTEKEMYASLRKRKIV